MGSIVTYLCYSKTTRFLSYRYIYKLFQSFYWSYNPHACPYQLSTCNLEPTLCMCFCYVYASLHTGISHNYKD